MFLSKHLSAFLKRHPQTNQFWLGFSGGLDSTVLLHALLHLPQKVSLRVVHINHGWSGDEEQAAHCVTAAEKYGISCEVITVNAQPQKGLSLEAIARHARYETFANLMQSEDCLLTAHHQDDQAETILLQLLRGAGVKGLAAMPENKLFAAGYHCRPLLNFSREDLRAYAEQQQLHWIDDHNNFNLEFNRNFIRHEVMPLLKTRWPDAQKTLARSAKHCAEADELLTVLAERNLEAVLNKKNNSLIITKLLQLTVPQQHNVLRYWLHQQNVSMPSVAQLERIQKDILQSRIDAQPKVCWGNVTLSKQRDELIILPRTN